MLGRRIAQYLSFIPVLVAAAVLATPVDGVSTVPSDQASGTLTIQAIQGTPGGPQIGITEVEVILYSKNRVIKTIDANLDVDGRAVIDGIPLDIDVRPVIRVKHAGVTYQEVGEVMNFANTLGAVEVVCYEVTNDIPLWKMSMRQVMLSYAPQGIQVTEIMVIMNPDDQTWLGVENSPNKPVTMELRLPASAKGIKLGTGFHDWCCTSVDSSTLVNHLPMMPQTTEMDFSYVIETLDGTFDLDIVAPAGVDEMIVVLPEDMHAHNIDGLSLGGTRMITDTSVRYYTASNLTKGSSVRLALSGLPMIHALTAQASQRTPMAISSELLVMFIGGGVILLVVGLVAFKKLSAH